MKTILRTLAIFCTAILIFVLYQKYEYQKTVLFDASKQEVREVEITLPNRWKYNDGWFVFFLNCDFDDQEINGYSKEYWYKQEKIPYIENILVENLLIKKNGLQSNLSLKKINKSMSFGSSHIAHVIIDPYPEQEEKYIFSLKDPYVLQGLQCDIDLWNPNI